MSDNVQEQTIDTPTETVNTVEPITLDSLLENEDQDVCKLVRTIASIGEEVTKYEDLIALVKSFLGGKKPEVICYDGFEPSGRMHIAQGLIRSMNVNKLTSCGFKFKFWVADWFAQMNLKFDGNMKRIRKAGELMIHMWKACGMDMDNVEFIWAADSIMSDPNYMQRVLDIMRSFTIHRLKKCGTIMGREESDSLMGSQLMYPAMQCSDIFHLKADICSLGMDQRKVNMLAREYSSKMKRKFHPIILSHHMLLGLDGTKMSKSNPENAIFMDDMAADVKRKINHAFCAPENIETNPILEYYRYIVFEKEESITLSVLNFETKERSDRTFNTFSDMEDAFAKGEIHPSDIKKPLIKFINTYLEPVRKYISENKSVKGLIKTVKSYKPKKATK